MISDGSNYAASNNQMQKGSLTLGSINASFSAEGAARTPIRLDGATASADSAIFAIARPRDWSAHQTHLTA
jgi:hypothetical protein